MSETSSSTYLSPSTSPKLIDRLQWPALIIGVVFLVLCGALGMAKDRDSFFRAYLYGWLFWTAIPLGAMAMASLHYLTGGNWGRLMRGVAESAAVLLPLNAILFIPVLFGLKSIYPWADLNLVNHDAVLTHKYVYMNPTWFTIRFVIYFAIWTFLTYLGVGLAKSYDRTRSELTYDRLRKTGAAYLVFYVALITLAGVDWIMSREPHWESTIFGFILVVDQTLTALLFIILIISQLVDRAPLGPFAKPQQYNDLGNLVLMLVILWAYMNFAQFLITWTGNEQEDIGWYVQRTSGGWKTVAGFLIYLHFLAPFLLLLSRDMKRNIKKFAFFCLCLLAMRMLDLYWLMTPAAHGSHPVMTDPASLMETLLELFAWLGIGGIFMFAFLMLLHRRSLLSQPFPEEIDDEKVSHGHKAPQPL